MILKNLFSKKKKIKMNTMKKKITRKKKSTKYKKALLFLQRFRNIWSILYMLQIDIVIHMLHCTQQRERESER